jgi:hypothetical protein
MSPTTGGWLREATLVTGIVTEESAVPPLPSETETFKVKVVLRARKGAVHVREAPVSFPNVPAGRSGSCEKE